MAIHEIKTPRGVVYKSMNKFGEIEVKLEWNAGFGQEWSEKFNSAQEWLDKQVVADCEPYVPFRTGMLRNLGILGTKPGSGEVIWLGPYARYQYYLKRKTRNALKPLAQSRWFEVAKSVYRDRWLLGVRERMKQK